MYLLPPTVSIFVYVWNKSSTGEYASNTMVCQKPHGCFEGNVDLICVLVCAWITFEEYTLRRINDHVVVVGKLLSYLLQSY